MIITNHARKRLEQRGISLDDVDFCVKNHHIVLEESKGCKIYIAKHPNSKRIQIVVDTSSSLEKLITAMWLKD